MAYFYILYYSIHFAFLWKAIRGCLVELWAAFISPRAGSINAKGNIIAKSCLKILFAKDTSWKYFKNATCKNDLPKYYPEQDKMAKTGLQVDTCFWSKDPDDEGTRGSREKSRRCKRVKGDVRGVPGGERGHLGNPRGSGGVKGFLKGHRGLMRSPGVKGDVRGVPGVQGDV